MLLNYFKKDHKITFKEEVYNINTTKINKLRAYTLSSYIQEENGDILLCAS